MFCKAVLLSTVNISSVKYFASFLKLLLIALLHGIAGYGFIPFLSVLTRPTSGFLSLALARYLPG